MKQTTTLGATALVVLALTACSNEGSGSANAPGTTADEAKDAVQGQVGEAGSDMLNAAAEEGTDIMDAAEQTGADIMDTAEQKGADHFLSKKTDPINNLIHLVGTIIAENGRQKIAKS